MGRCPRIGTCIAPACQRHKSGQEVRPADGERTSLRCPAVRVHEARAASQSISLCRSPAARCRRGGLTPWKRSRMPRRPFDPGRQAGTPCSALVHPDESPHWTPRDVHRRGPRLCEGFGLLFGPDAEHETADLYATDHVTIEHPAVAPEHLLLDDVRAAAKRLAHAFGELRVMRHGSWFPRRGAPPARPARSAGRRWRTGRP